MCLPLLSRHRGILRERSPWWPWLNVLPDIDVLSDWGDGALAALQDDAEQLLVERFQRAGGLLADFKHKTVGARHFQIAARTLLG